VKTFVAAILLVFLVAGCTSRRCLPDTCPENPDYYHVYGPGPTQPQKVNPLYLRHVRKEDWKP
jgi:hypothetical protein